MDSNKINKNAKVSGKPIVISKNSIANKKISISPTYSSKKECGGCSRKRNG